jgi:hypothetical protein
MAKHDYDITEWCDFVRGLVDSDRARAMSETLASAPRRTRRRVEALRRVAEVGRADAELEIPAHALRGAKAIGSLWRPASAEEPEGARGGLLKYLPFTVAFDSFHQPAAVGTRDLQASDRQMIFDAASYRVDVRMEHETNPPSTVLVGELLRGARPVPRVPVMVLAGDRVVGRSLTGRFGEFQAEGLPADPLRLCLLLDDEECIDLPLGEE